MLSVQNSRLEETRQIDKTNYSRRGEEREKEQERERKRIQPISLKTTQIRNDETENVNETHILFKLIRV